MATLNVKRTLREHLKARRLREMTQKAEDQYKGILKDFLLSEGTVDDAENGSRWYRFSEDDDPFVDEADGKVVTAIKAERRCPQVFNEEAALKLIEKYNVRGETVVVETVEVINEDALLALAFAGKIPDAEVQALYEEGKETFAFKVIKESV